MTVAIGAILLLEVRRNQVARTFYRLARNLAYVDFSETACKVSLHTDSDSAFIRSVPSGQRTRTGPSASTGNLCGVLPARNAARCVLRLDAPAAPSLCGLAIDIGSTRQLDSNERAGSIHVDQTPLTRHRHHERYWPRH